MLEGAPIIGLRFFFYFFSCRCGGIVPSKAICDISLPYPDKKIRRIL